MEATAAQEAQNMAYAAGFEVTHHGPANRERYGYAYQIHMKRIVNGKPEYLHLGVDGAKFVKGRISRQQAYGSRTVRNLKGLAAAL